MSISFTICTFFKICVLKSVTTHAEIKERFYSDCYLYNKTKALSKSFIFSLNFCNFGFLFVFIVAAGPGADGQL